MTVARVTNVVANAASEPRAKPRTASCTREVRTRRLTQYAARLLRVKSAIPIFASETFRARWVAPHARGYRVGQTRREFLKSTSTAALAGIAAQSSTGRFATAALVSPLQSPYSAQFAGEPNIKELAAVALDAAKSAGADYADVRFVRNRNQNVSTREQRVSGVSDNETYGFGIRTLVTGAWGFAASRDLTKDEVT